MHKVKPSPNQACLEAWMNCERLLGEPAPKGANQPSRIEKLIDECARICRSTWQAMTSRSTSFHKLALLCIGICEECAEECEKLKDKRFLQCAQACRRCADSFASLAYAATYN